MSSTLLVITVIVLAVLALAVALTSLRRRDADGLGHLAAETRRRDAQSAAEGSGASDEARELERSVALARTAGSLEAAPPRPVAEWSPPDPDEVGVTRRQFLNRASIQLMGASLGAFGAANIAFLWPRPSKGFGGKVKIGTIDSVNSVIASSSPATNFSYFSEAQTYLQPYPLDSASQSAAEAVYTGSVLDGIKQGYVALWQKCPHLGCKVPVCASSQWFECPCHGSQYNRVGEKKAGPAPRGMDRFPIIIDGVDVIIDTGSPKQGPAIGVDTTKQGLEGPHCA